MKVEKGTLVLRDKDSRFHDILALVDFKDQRDIAKAVESIEAVKSKYEDWNMDDIYGEAFSDYDCDIIVFPTAYDCFEYYL